MTVKGFIFLMVVTIGAVMVFGTLVADYTAEGLQRTLTVAILTGLVVFPAARWAEKRGWIKGTVRMDRLGDEFRRPRPGQDKRATPADAEGAAGREPGDR